MKDLGKWQIISFISRGIALLLGIVQGAIIVRLLPQADWGIKELALSVGGALGIYQHLGLASASTREISSAKDATEIFKIFVTSSFVRYCVSLPLAVGLFVFSGYIGTHVYNYPQLPLLLKIYAVMLLFQGFQSILNSVIQGTMRFKRLFIYQVLIAFVSIALYLPFVYFYKLNGFFYALLAFNIINTLILAFLAFRPLRGKIIFPSKEDFKRLLKELFTISMAIYVVKVIYTNWEKLGNNILGFAGSAQLVAIYGFALIFAKKILSISDAVTDVNLPVLSEKYVNDLKDFKHTFSRNFNKIYALILLSATAATYWAPQIVYIYTGSQRYYEYLKSLPLIPTMVLAFVLYSLINIVKSSVLIPAKMSKEMILSFVVMALCTLLFFFGAKNFMNNLSAMAYGMLFGGLVGFCFMVCGISKKLSFNFFGKDHWLVLIQSYFICLAGLVENAWVKTALFVPFFLLLLYGLDIAGLLTRKDIAEAKSRCLALVERLRLAR